jgi:hypothetical protein
MASQAAAKFTSWEGIEKDEWESLTASINEVVGLLDEIEEAKANSRDTQKQEAKLEAANAELKKMWSVDCGPTGNSSVCQIRARFTFTAISKSSFPGIASASSSQVVFSRRSSTDIYCVGSAPVSRSRGHGQLEALRLFGSHRHRTTKGGQ